MKINVKEIVNNKKEEFKKTIHLSFVEPPKLLIIQIGNDSASNSYIKGKMKDCKELGIFCTLMKFNPPENVSETQNICNILTKITPIYDGVILQEPASLVNKQSFLDQILNSKNDVDGFRKDSKFLPCTPQGIMEILKIVCGDRKNLDLSGKTVVVLGRGKLVGKPIVPMLIDKHATVIECNSTTSNMKDFTKIADIVIAATGQPNLIKREDLKEGAIVIDAGIYVTEDGHLQGDCDKKLYEDETIQVTPVPGGVGLMTRVMLMKNVIDAKMENIINVKI